MPRDMGMVVSLFLALAAMVTVYGWLGQGGGVAGLVFFGVLLVGALINLAQPKSDA
jgi:prepilin signal peptidase PulO-like enzyme (type II secretory pathway)